MNIDEVVFTFGKHEGLVIYECDDFNYLFWLMSHEEWFRAKHRTEYYAVVKRLIRFLKAIALDVEPNPSGPLRAYTLKEFLESNHG